MKKTQWFPASVKPVNVGVYEARNVWSNGDLGEKGFAHWDGDVWGNVRPTAEGAAAFRKKYGSNDYGNQLKVWRGLTERAA